MKQMPTKSGSPEEICFQLFNHLRLTRARIGVFSHHGEVPTLKRQTLVAVLALVLVALDILDIVTTQTAIAHGAQEANILAIALFAMLGFAGGVLLKLSAVVTFGFLSVFSYHLHWKTLRICLTTCLCALIVMYTIVVINNAVLSYFT
jgi:hypothetical protein